jgi:hypothetical protein
VACCSAPPSLRPRSTVSLPPPKEGPSPSHFPVAAYCFIAPIVSFSVLWRRIGAPQVTICYDYYLLGTNKKQNQFRVAVKMVWDRMNSRGIRKRMWEFPWKISMHTNMHRLKYFRPISS